MSSGDNSTSLIPLILEKSKYLQGVINNNFLLKYCELHNIPAEYSMFEMKQEVVARRAYFQGVKKKYALHIINKEGRDIDETDIKGLVSVRSDYASITKAYTEEIVNMLIYDEKVSFTKIKNYVKEKRTEIIDLILEGDKRVCRPVSFAKKLSDYKTIPGHVRGMILWNQLEYNHFSVGSKGYEFKLQGIDPFTAPSSVLEKYQSVEKLPNSISIPYEVDKLPSYYIVDVDAQLDFVWNDRVDELLTPIFKENK